MEIVLANEWLEVRGGTEIYTLTLADHLQRLGHAVTIHALRQGPLAGEAREAGLRVARDESELPARCDAAVVQDSVVAYELAARWREAPRLFVAHSELGLQLPPPPRGAVAGVVVMHDRMRRRVEAMRLGAPVIRLRQPVDTERFSPRRPLSPRPRRALLLGNYLRGPRRDLLVAELERAGIEWRAIGRFGEGIAGGVERAMDEADIVIGKARVIVEAMAAGRAAYVYDWNGCDGWVTPERYELLESDNFGGQAEATAVSAERIRADLAAYDPAMGVANRDLAVANHSAMKHAEAMVAALPELRPQAPPGSPDELARLSRENMRMEFALLGRGSELADLREEVVALRARVDELTVERDDAREHWRRVEDFRLTRRFRIAQALGRPADVLRSLRRR